MRILPILVSFVTLSVSTAICNAQIPKAKSGDWPWWRGPHFNGIAEANQKLAISWDKSTNVAWKVEIPGRGHSSPTVVGNRIFLTTADNVAKTQSVLCYDRKTGAQLWKEEINRGGFPARINRQNTHASPSVACDGDRLIVAVFNHAVIQAAAYDLNGQLLWKTVVGKFEPDEYKNGYAASPLIYGDNVIFATDYDGECFLVALDRTTGKSVWKTARPARISYASPVIAHVADRDQLLMSGCDMVAGYDPKTGKLLWKVAATTMATCGTMVWDGDLVFASGGYPKSETVCIRADGSGEIVWKNNQKSYEQSMLTHDGFLYTVNDRGIALCWKADSGEEMWRERLTGPISASPVLAGGNIYVSNERGTSWVFKANPKSFDLVSKNQLGTEAFASPTICGGQIFLRVAETVDNKRQETLYCIQAKSTR